ncbi:mechanosensitive ion channel family protein [Algimonas porphyrae]|uniref:Small-conductance mechanosensitive channel n=1 Tax=Algimonas porphyrae TaxID=1128113 RepID=A0ABQ5V0F7_9PROT|nr:mechanosensitive ion channel family protein [Algimonas porphyrae]GLQ20562.1 mechanosensitive ion channel protein MscS [Algimonas porphyrae]
MDVIADYWAQAQEQFPFLLSIGGNILAAALIFVLGLIVGRSLSKRMRRSRFGGSHLDATLRPVLASLVFYVILAMTLYAVLIKLGVPPAALVAVFGAAGLAIGLALRDTLSNIAAGVMLLILRPLKVGDFVDIGQSTLGTVEEIGLFTSTIRNVENVAVYLPNSLVWGNRVQNFGRHVNRKAIVDIGVGYDTDLKAARQLLLDLIGAHPGVIPFDESGTGAPTPPEVYVMGFGDSAINLSCRCWLPGDQWLQRMTDLRVAIKSALDDAGVEIPFPQRVVHMAKTPE